MDNPAPVSRGCFMLMGYYLFNNLYKSYFYYNIDIIILYKKNPIVNL